MKDLNDTTIDLIQAIEINPTPKKRGRPATGRAKTPSERQAEYRAKKEDECNRNLNIWVHHLTLKALERLAKNENVTKIEILEKLINQADNKSAKKAADAGTWEKYWNL